ncbi:lipopolysaccharide biosynthesis protein [Sphingosinicella humi]|uniref:lipopolysaccharide biosynthesis protein n=1 Tax=Allosphingosinicella humi TaxID=2068657 RepID=UPI001FB14567|nr:lipopolysaccharide biosynthesis protein [Sphingosinicella humi]
MTTDRKSEEDQGPGLEERVRGAVLWRSGSQVVAQIVAWASTFLVIRLLEPSDYGLFAMSQVVLVFLNLMNGHGFASALVQSESIDGRRIAQAFGMLLLLNGALALVQLLTAPLVAAYFRQPALVDMLRVQALLYAATPFIALPSALLSREIDFRRQAKVNLVSAFLAAATALGCALWGFGVWSLVAAPIVLFWSRAIGLTLMTRWLVWPSFRFADAGGMLGYGGALVLVQFFWFLQSQADVFIAGRRLGTHELGLYTTALFLTQILAAKFVPPLNEVAFAAYSRIQADRGRMALAFVRATRLIMLIALPFYLGLAVTAEPLVLTMLGPKWVETIAIVPILALAMPFLTLQILFAPATNATGQARIAIRTGAAGAVLLPLAFLIGVRFGILGLAYGWLVGMILLTAVTAMLSRAAISLDLGAVARAVKPGLLASTAMAALILSLDSLLPPMPPQPRLALLVFTGVAVYAGLLLAFARPLVLELIGMIRSRSPAAATA